MRNGIFQKLKWLLIAWLARRLPDCKRMTRTLGESLDRKTTWREKLVMDLHLFTCEACERYLQQVVFLRDAIHAHGERDPEIAELSVQTLSIESKEKMKAFLRNNVGLAF
jgi:hypothetical protein